MLQTLRAVEKTLQARFEFGIGQRLIGFPILRLGTNGFINRHPKPSDSETLTNIMDSFVIDLAIARASLERADSAEVVPFEMALTDIWFDINSNGVREEHESAIALLGAAVLGGRAYRDYIRLDASKDPLVVRFDNSDLAWLLAYTHMFSVFGDLFMAFDPAPVFQALAAQKAVLANAPQIPNYYDPKAVVAEIVALETEKVVLEERQEALQEQINPLYDTVRNLRNKLKQTEDETLKSELTAERSRKQAELDLLRTELRQVR